MEFIVLFSFLLVFTYVVVKKFLRHNDSSNPLNLILGPQKLPIIGNLHLPRPGHQTRSSDAAAIRQNPFVIVLSAEAAKRTHDITFANRIPTPAAALMSYNYSNIATAPYSDDWRHLKKISTLEVLSSQRVKSSGPIQEEENLSLAKWIVSNEGVPTNLSERFYLTSLDIITRSSTGSNIDEQRDITTLIDEIIKLSSGLSILDLYPSSRLIAVISRMSSKLKRIYQRMNMIIQNIVDRHKAAVDAAATTDDPVERSKDLVDVLLEYQGDEVELHLTTDTIKAMILSKIVCDRYEMRIGLEHKLNMHSSKLETNLRSTLSFPFT